ncbi:hypothetical protein FFLO_04326 [Filobasidium floriforme]|uniref:WD repeat-containing protein JIP5 n=1 Tax=Filobasidium floriforme TaxID=5210 RepID=A0A8K0NMG2_9TREE|nr:hypothetical protein FFLO_04326 [Filobasidium floriforme]
MPDFKLENQPFDLAFHPTEPLVYTSLLTGEVKAFRYDDNSGDIFQGWTVRPSKKCCRSLVVQQDGSKIWAVGKAGGIHCIDSLRGTVVEDRLEAHSAPINRITNLFENMFATGDDDGVIKLWDHRQPQMIREYPHHWEYISDFEFLEDKKQLVSTSGDGTLSVIDVRSNTATPLEQSEDQEDELLSIVSIKGGAKHVVGTQLGVVTVWDRTKGWSDSIDRIMGSVSLGHDFKQGSTTYRLRASCRHPQSVETLVALTPDVIATGSEDGIIRVMQIQPNKLLGAIATHGDFPIERIKLDRNGKFLGSVSHDDCLKLTDVSEILEDSDDEEEDEEKVADQEDDNESVGTVKGKGRGENASADAESGDSDDDERSGDSEDSENEVDEHGSTAMDTSDDEEDRADRKRKKREERRKMKKEKRKTGPIKTREQEEAEKAEKGFFDDL